MRERAPRWSWAGITVFVIAFFLSAAWGTALVMGASARTPPINDTTADLLSAVGGVLAGCVAAYVGGIVGRRWEKNHEDEEPPDL